MIILGINAYHADSSAAIFVNGEMIAAIEEERFTRIKHWAGFPIQAIEFCLKEAGITLQEVDQIAIGRDPKAKIFNKIIFLAKHPISGFRAIQERLNNRKEIQGIAEPLAEHFSLDLAQIESKINYVEHHASHIASAFFASPFEKAACLSIDGSGDFSTTMLGIGDGNHIQILDSLDFPHSLGLFYTAFTQFLGFPHYGDEYKVMGMAPYGEPRYTHLVEKLIKLTPDGLFRLDLTYFKNAGSGVMRFENHIPIIAPLFNEKFIQLIGKPRESNEPLESSHQDLAASVQQVTENVIFHILNHLQKRTGLSRVCIAGGVAQNSVANGKITKNTTFKEVYIPSAGHDAGISMGAGLYVQHHLHHQNRVHIRSAYTGSRFSNDEIELWLTQKGIKYQRLEDDLLYDKVTDCMINGGVVGWMQGRAEFGPRALGGRSILADPRRIDAKELLNVKIKRRESFRPFAPSILAEYVSEYFELDEPVPFMERVFPIKKEKRALIPAVCHVDGSGRLQSVYRDVSPRYHALIENFRNKTGVPILLNTSFNENEPIVNTPAEAYNCFARTMMDMLVLENIIIVRS